MALRSDSLNLISICTGGGGLDLGVELAIPCARSVCLVEREAFCVSQLVSAMQQGLLAPAPVWSDARTFNGRAWRGAVDGLIGGIPCQPHSLAGKRLERADPRDLWSTARRIIVQSGAWFVLIENVEGMLSSGGRMTRSGDRNNEELLNGQSSRLAQVISTDGAVPSIGRRSLNPLFVEWLMGWPPGWTLLAWTDFACSEMELSRFKQRMRSALSQLASPAAAPPAQLALWG